jgi:hypothetical protein
MNSTFNNSTRNNNSDGFMFDGQKYKGLRANSKNDGVVFKSSANAAAYPARERFNEDATSVISEQKS